MLDTSWLKKTPEEDHRRVVARDRRVHRHLKRCPDGGVITGSAPEHHAERSRAGITRKLKSPIALGLLMRVSGTGHGPLRPPRRRQRPSAPAGPLPDPEQDQWPGAEVDPRLQHPGSHVPAADWAVVLDWRPHVDDQFVPLRTVDRADIGPVFRTHGGAAWRRTYCQKKDGMHSSRVHPILLVELQVRKVPGLAGGSTRGLRRAPRNHRAGAGRTRRRPRSAGGCHPGVPRWPRVRCHHGGLLQAQRA